MKTLGYRFLYGLLMLLSLPLFAQDKVRNEIEKRATKLFEEGQYLTALPDFRQLLSSNPEDADLNFYYGACLLASDEDPEEAVKHLSFAVKSFSIDPRAYYFLGQAYHTDYRFADAEKSYQRFLDKADSKVKASFPETERLIVMAQNGKQLLSNIKDIKVISKTESTVKDFFRNYEMSEVGGSIITVPDELLSSEDKKRGHRSLMHFDPKKNTCYFSSYGKGSDLNIYSAIRSSNGSFSKPIELLGPVNTEFDEDYPFMHENGTTLYFSSKGHNSMGGYDIFSADLNSGVVKNMDFAISSADDDIFYMVDKKGMWANFASSRNSEEGRLHVYQVKVSDAPLELALISGKVINEIGGMAAARIKVVDAKTDEVIGNYQSDTNGDYLIDLPGMGKYMFYVDVTGSDLTHVGTVDVPSFGEVRAFKQEMSLVEVSSQEKLLIKNNFEETVEGDIMALAQDILKRQADLEVNADADELIAQQDNTQSILPDEELLIRAGFRRDIGMDVVLALGYDQSEGLQKSALAEENERSKTAGVFKKEIDESLTLANQANSIYEKYKTSEDQSEKDAFLVQAASLRLQSEQHLRKAEEAMMLIEQLDQSISSKSAAAQELEARNARLETEIFNADNDAVITLLREIKETEDVGINNVNILDEASKDVQDKRKEAARTLSRLEEVQDARDRVQASYKMKAVQVKRYKNSKDKAIVQAEAEALEAELADLNEQVDKVSERLEEVQYEADVAEGALSLLERMRVGEDEELVNISPLMRSEFNLDEERSRGSSISALNDEVVIVQDELTYALVNNPDFTKSANGSELLEGYGISEDLLTFIEENSASNTDITSDELIADQSEIIKGISPSYESNMAALEIGENARASELQKALDLKKELSEQVQTALTEESIDPGQRQGLEALYQQLQEETSALETRIGAESIASESSDSGSSEEVDMNLVGMSESVFNDWMDHAGKANIEDISRSNANFLAQGEPESLNTPSGLAGRMEKHANYIQMVNAIKSERQRSLVNNPAGVSKIRKELDALDEVVSIKAQVMSRELREWEKQSSIFLTEQERIWALNNPRYLQERTSIEGMDLSNDERVAAITSMNAEMRENNSALLISEVPDGFASSEQTDLSSGNGNSSDSGRLNSSQSAGAQAPRPGVTGSFDLVLTDVMGSELPDNEDVYTLDAFLTDSEWSQSLFKSSESKEELENTLPMMDEYFKTKESMIPSKKRYTENVISMSMATPTAKEFKSRLEALQNTSTVSQSWIEQSKSLFGRADELRMGVTIKEDQTEVNEDLREALFMEMKALDLLNRAQSYENHLASGKSPSSFQYVDAIVLDYTSEPESDLALNEEDQEVPMTEPQPSETQEALDKSTEEVLKTSENAQEILGENSTDVQIDEGEVFNEVSNTLEGSSVTEGIDDEVPTSEVTEVIENQTESEPAPTENLSTSEVVDESNTLNETLSETSTSDQSIEQLSVVENQIASTEAKSPESIDAEIPELTTREDMDELSSLDLESALSAYPKAASSLAAMELKAPEDMSKSISLDPSEVESVTLETEVAEQLSPQEMETLKINKAEYAAVVSYEQELKNQQLAYQEAIQKRRLRMAEVIDIVPEERTDEQKLELQKLTAETLVLESYLAETDLNIALAEDKRSELKTSEAKLALQLVNTNTATTPEQLTETQIPDPSDTLEDEMNLLVENNEVSNEVEDSPTELEDTPAEDALQNIEDDILPSQELVNVNEEETPKETEDPVNEKSNDEVPVESDIEIGNAGSVESIPLDEEGVEDLTLNEGNIEGPNETITPSIAETEEITAEVGLTEDSNTTTSPLEERSPESVVSESEEAPVVETIDNVPPDWTIPEVLVNNVFAVESDVTRKEDTRPFAPVPVSALPAGLVYQVQVGAFRNAIPDSQFEAFRPVLKEGLSSGITRYTVGLFMNESSAASAKNQVRAMGYSDAFVVAYKDGKRVSLTEARNSGGGIAGTPDGQGTESFLTYTQPEEVVKSDVTSNPSDNTGTTESRTADSNTTTRVSDAGGSVEEEASRKEYYELVENAAPANQVEVIDGLFYTVQVGLYSKPVTSSAIYNLSPLNSELMENGRVKYTSGIFDNLDVAVNWREKVVERGVEDAFVTAYYNGERISISRARELLESDEEVLVKLDELSDLERDREGQAIWEMVSTSELFGDAIKESVIFKIRMGPYTDRIPDKDVRVILDFEDNVEYGRRDDGTIVYTTKGVMSYEEAQKWRTTFLDEGVTNANIVAFRDGEEIDVKQALDFLLK